MRRIIIIVTTVFLLLGNNVLFAGNHELSPQEKDYRNSLKITFLSWISGSTKISYERAFSNIRQSGEFCTSLIGAGFDKYDNDPKGFTMRYGHKFFFKNNSNKSLMGFYLRPEVVYSNYHYNRRGDGLRTLANETALLGTIGYQYVHKRLLADFWVGGGPAFGTPAETFYHHGFELWHFFNTVNTNIALSFSIRIGICF
ncbi:MAG: hypothetical protein IJZ06_02680 [Bacteroidales bacterium]|nr:hypothetical protein [Bacteroidales bacterium]